MRNAVVVQVRSVESYLKKYLFFSNVKQMAMLFHPASNRYCWRQCDVRVRRHVFLVADANVKSNMLLPFFCTQADVGGGGN